MLNGESVSYRTWSSNHIGVKSKHKMRENKALFEDEYQKDSYFFEKIEFLQKKKSKSYFISSCCIKLYKIYINSINKKIIKKTQFI